MKYRDQKRGQVIVLVTLALIAMMGLMGLAVDFGWAFYVEKWEQKAADAAALAAAKEALKIGGIAGPYAPPNSRVADRNGTPTTITIADPSQGAPVQCPSSAGLPARTSSAMTNVDIACIYALEHGFEVAEGTRQNVTVENADTSPPPTAPGVDSVYWVTVRIAQQIPQLFSSVLGNTEGLTASIATAAIVDADVIGTLLLLNREGDCAIDTDGKGTGDCGLNFYSGGGGDLTVEGGVIISSGADGTAEHSATENVAAEISGSGTVTADYIDIRDTGTYIDSTNSGGKGLFDPTPNTGVADAEGFLDPFRDRGQPPLFDPAAGPPSLRVYPIRGGVISSAMFENGLPPGIYYPADPLTDAPINKQIVIEGTHSFVGADGAGTFEDYYFIGGLQTGLEVNLSLAPGRYVFVEVPSSQTDAPFALNWQNDNPAIADTVPAGTGEQGAGGTAGVILINATRNYPGLKDVLNNVNQGGEYVVGAGILNDPALGLDFGGAAIKSGNSDNSYVRLHGLNEQANTFPPYLKAWRSVLYWQDRQNSTVLYDPKYFKDDDPEFNKEGHIFDIDPTTRGGDCDGDFSVACDNPAYENKDPIRTKFYMHATSSLDIYGVIYQPRGSHMDFQGSPTGSIGAVQMITGAFSRQGGGSLTLGPLENPALTRIVALVH